MFDYLKGIFSAANLAFYYRGVAERRYWNSMEIREALTRADAPTQSRRTVDKTQTKITD